MFGNDWIIRKLLLVIIIIPCSSLCCIPTSNYITLWGGIYRRVLLWHSQVLFAELSSFYPVDVTAQKTRDGHHWRSFCFYHVRFPKGKDVVNMLWLRYVEGMPKNLSCNWSTRFMKVILLGLSLVSTSLQYRRTGVLDYIVNVHQYNWSKQSVCSSSVWK